MHTSRLRFAFASAVVIAVSLVAASVSAPAAETGDDDRNVRVRIVVRATEGPEGVAAQREYDLMLAPGRSGELVTGRMVPIPTTTFNTSQSVGGAIVPVTSFTYQTIGFQAQMELAPETTGDGRLRLRGQIEDSRLARIATDVNQPEVGTVQQKVDVWVRPGTPVVVHRSVSRDSSVEIEITAEVAG